MNGAKSVGRCQHEWNTLTAYELRRNEQVMESNRLSQVLSIVHTSSCVLYDRICAACMCAARAINEDIKFKNLQTSIIIWRVCVCVCVLFSSFNRVFEKLLLQINWSEHGPSRVSSTEQ